MRFLTFKNSSLIASLLTTSFVVGKEAQTNTKEMNAKDTMTSGYNAPYGINVQRAYDFLVSASFIYMQPIQENMELGVVSDSSVDTVNGHEVDLNTEYRPGFKVGIGMNFEHDNWDTYAEYTWFRATEHVHKNLDPSNTQVILFPAWQIPDFVNPQYYSGSEKWKLHMDIVDWDLGRGFSVGKKLDFRTFMGLRAAWIRQSVNVDYTNPTSGAGPAFAPTSIEQSSNSWGIGPRMGLTSNWRFCENFRLYGMGEVDILYTEYDWKANQTAHFFQGSVYHVNRNNDEYLRAHVDLGLGLGWGTYLSNSRYHIDFSADYSFQVFFDQNMFRSTFNVDSVGKSNMPNGNLYLQGLTITARFDF